MLKRRLQTTGKGSFIVTLPVSIILALDIKKGDTIEMKLEGEKIILNPVRR
jgi:antitoxin component of MazEF toxin-antitoxin module